MGGRAKQERVFFILEERRKGWDLLKNKILLLLHP
jgi:hypothetical protein